MSNIIELKKVINIAKVKQLYNSSHLHIKNVN